MSILTKAPLYAYASVDMPSDFNDDELVQRIARAHQIASQEFAGHGSSFWRTFEEKHRDIEDALNSGNTDELARLLRNPSETELFYGFDDLVKSYVTDRNASPEMLRVGAAVVYEILIQVAMGSGAIRCNYPEAGQGLPEIPIEQLLLSLDSRFGFRIEFQNPFKFEFGLSTSRGIISYRAAQSLYQTWRVKQICDLIEGAKVLEIGAGLGRNAYFARCFGIKNYTIVDIPRTQLAQGYYLGRVMGDAAVSLHGEPDSDIRLRSPKWLFETSENFDFVLNVDSLTEMDREHALAYLRFAKDHSKAFLSINHEFNPATAEELIHEIGMKAVHRSPYWPRAGYVEELCLLRLNNHPINSPPCPPRTWRQSLLAQLLRRIIRR